MCSICSFCLWISSWNSFFLISAAPRSTTPRLTWLSKSYNLVYVTHKRRINVMYLASHCIIAGSAMYVKFAYSYLWGFSQNSHLHVFGQTTGQTQELVCECVLVTCPGHSPALEQVTGRIHAWIDGFVQMKLFGQRTQSQRPKHYAK